MSGQVTSSSGRRMAELVPVPSWLARLDGSSPKFVGGLARVCDVITEDGALPAALKMLFAAAICAVKRDAAWWITSWPPPRKPGSRASTSRAPPWSC